MPKPGDYVVSVRYSPLPLTAGQPDAETEGVFLKDFGDGTIEVLCWCGGDNAPYRCYGPRVAVVVPDDKMNPDCLQWVTQVRASYGLGGA